MKHEWEVTIFIGDDKISEFNVEAEDITGAVENAKEEAEKHANGEEFEIVSVQAIDVEY